MRCHWVKGVALLAILLSCGRNEVTADDAMKRLPRRQLNTLQNVRLSIATDNWSALGASADTPREFEREIRRRIAKPNFWAPSSAHLMPDQPEVIVVLSADDLGEGRTILLLHAVLVETVAVGSSNERRRAVTWYGRPWFGTSYPSALRRVVQQGKDFIIADLGEFVNYR